MSDSETYVVPVRGATGVHLAIVQCTLFEMKFILQMGAWIGILASLGAAVTTAVFALAAGANATEEQLDAIYFVIAGSGAAALTGIAAAIALLRSGRPALALLTSFLPIPAMLVLLFSKLQ